MRVQVLGTQKATEKLLVRELERWANTYREDLSMSAIRAATPKELCDELPNAPAGPAELLLAAIDYAQSIQALPADSRPPQRAHAPRPSP